jgi:prohibitin 2
MSSLKEVAALQSAEQIVKNREQIKTRALELARKKIGTLLVVEDLVIQNIAVTKELEHAIEAKMVQEQEAAKSKYLQQRAQIEAGHLRHSSQGRSGIHCHPRQSLARKPCHC